MKILLLISLLVSGFSLAAQPKTNYRIATDDSTLNAQTSFTQMPFNRLIKSAGKVVSYGNPEYENHTLDVAPLPGNKFIAVEDRYGFAILDTKSKEVKKRWTFPENTAYKDVMSTYSGIAAFSYNNVTYITWGGAGKGVDRAFVMIAEWNGSDIKNVSAIQLKAIAPATTALPNQVIYRVEEGVPYLYVVENGNNRLLKINFTNKQIVWTAATGVAPFGLYIIDSKAYVTNWAGPIVADTTSENAGTPWGRAYTDPATGATRQGNLSIIDTKNGSAINQLQLGLHPNAIVGSGDNRFLYVTNGNSDFVSVIDVNNEQVIDSIAVGLFSKHNVYYGSSPNGLLVDSTGTRLYVANGLDNAIAVIKLGKKVSVKGIGKTEIMGYIPTEAYPSGIALVNQHLYVTNLEAKGARVQSEPKDLKRLNGKPVNAYSIHKQLASLSIIAVPGKNELKSYTEQVKSLNLFNRIALTNLPARKNVAPKPVPERIGEPSVFKHVIYIIKENKTYDQVFGDIKQGRGDAELCIYGENITPNQHKLAADFSLMDNYYASGKSSAEGHQWTDAAMVSDYVQKNVRAWFRSYPHRQTDALVYNKTGFIWNNALDHGKTVRVYGEACTTIYDKKLKWIDFYNKLMNKESVALKNTSTIARLRPIISPEFPDCDNISFPDQLRADIFLKEWKHFENQPGDQLPELMVLSLPNNHTAGTSPGFPVPKAMVADNDLALGRIIDAITKSRFWDSTVVFVTEDDSQSGWDHISSYRTTGLVISKYSTLQKTVHTNYNQTSMVRTIEQILGIPPMNVIDASALPMFDCFTNKKTDYTYHFVPNKVPLNEMNKQLSQLKGKSLYFAKLSANSVFNEIDGGEDDKMNQVLWFDAKGEKKYPVFK
ncbi:MAG: phosphoesterase [Segetibacter sp.]|nr:phosphoesterase [Segetibacter sp.]